MRKPNLSFGSVDAALTLRRPAGLALRKTRMKGRVDIVRYGLLKSCKSEQ